MKARTRAHQMRSSRIRLNRSSYGMAVDAAEAASSALPAETISDDLPAIRPTHPRWYRVMRAKYPSGHRELWAWECIAETPTEIEAVRIATSQRHLCAVQDCHGRTQYRNGQPMKEYSL